MIVGFGDYRAELEARRAAAARSSPAPLEHRHLVHLLPLADAAVVRRSSPRRSGWSPPRPPPPAARRSSRSHSGLEEIAEGLEAEYPPEHRDLTSFATGDADDLRAKLERLLSLAPPSAPRLAEAARSAALSRWSWRSVAEAAEPFH